MEELLIGPEDEFAIRQLGSVWGEAWNRHDMHALALSPSHRWPNASLLMVFAQRLTYDVFMVALPGPRDQAAGFPKSSHRSA
jgi:hypothetical protein